MVESNQQQQQQVQQEGGSIKISDYLAQQQALAQQQNPQKQEAPQRRAHFDEDELNEYDKTRGRCMKIDDPKTPYHEGNSSEEEAQDLQAMNQQNNQNELDEDDPLVQDRLKEAKKNREKNSQLTAQGGSGGNALDMNALMSKMQATVDEDEAQENKKKQFRAKMKSHYAGEFNAAALMRQKPNWDASDEDDD